MSVYSITYDNDKILDLVSNYKNVLLIGCGGCANESLAFSNHLPIYVAPKDSSMEDAIENMQAIAYSVKDECERIKRLLEDYGYYVMLSIIPLSQNTLCIRHPGDKYNFIPDSHFIPDIILTISCSAGAYGIYEDINGKIPVYSIMESVGQLAYYYEDLANERKIVYEKSKVIC